MKRVRVIISGRVQGVGFRYFVQEKALHFGIKGYVKNLPGENVEIDAEGDEMQLDRFLAACRRGSLHARIDDFIVQKIPVFGYTRFRIRHCSDF
ncbi:acylphosphatase [Thermophagus sp. OGC60D27]|uniref:acylphosphatase n=1 Tax=Thermophagus sp. OGC60D27 TaxID=3458415 RepID=UPI0040378F9F